MAASEKLTADAEGAPGRKESLDWWRAITTSADTFERVTKLPAARSEVRGVNMAEEIAMAEANGTGGSAWDLSGTFDFEGQHIRYGVLGEGSPLVLLHGTPFSSVVWRRIAPYLARHRRVFYFDLLGYGRSEMHRGQDVSLGIQNLVFSCPIGSLRPGTTGCRCP